MNYPYTVIKANSKTRQVVVSITYQQLNDYRITVYIPQVLPVIEKQIDDNGVEIEVITGERDFLKTDRDTYMQDIIDDTVQSLLQTITHPVEVEVIDQIFVF